MMDIISASLIKGDKCTHAALLGHDADGHRQELCRPGYRRIVWRFTDCEGRILAPTRGYSCEDVLGRTKSGTSESTEALSAWKPNGCPGGLLYRVKSFNIVMQVRDQARLPGKIGCTIIGGCARVRRIDIDRGRTCYRVCTV